MSQIKVLNSKETKRISALFEEQFAVALPKGYAYLMKESGKLYMITRDIEKVDSENVRIDSTGLYIAAISENQVRLSIEGSQIIGKDASKNVFELDDVQLDVWLKGEDIICDPSLKGSLIMKNGNDFYGCGIAKNSVILNHVPKERRIKN